MSFIVVIPSRYASTRLPGKPLADIAGKPLIQHVVERANQSSAARVIVALDDTRIRDALGDVDCEICMTRADHMSGSDRLAEVVEVLQIDDNQVIVNVQGDEPLIPPQLIDRVGQVLHSDVDAAMATAAHKISSVDEANDPNVVKVVFDQAGRALYFSRSPIPYHKQSGNENSMSPGYWRHIGIYAYRARFLRHYQSLSASQLEQTESLEQLRVMDNGQTIMVEPIDYDPGVGVDTAQDLAQVRQILSNK